MAAPIMAPPTKAKALVAIMACFLPRRSATTPTISDAIIPPTEKMATDRAQRVETVVGGGGSPQRCVHVVLYSSSRTFWGALMTPTWYPTCSDPKTAVPTAMARVGVSPGGGGASASSSSFWICWNPIGIVGLINGGQLTSSN